MCVCTDPVCAPRVPADPELLARVLVPAPAHHRDLVVDPRMLQLLPEDASLVLVEQLRGVHPAPDGAALPDLLLHVLRAAHVAVLVSEISGNDSVHARLRFTKKCVKAKQTS